MVLAWLLQCLDRHEVSAFCLCCCPPLPNRCNGYHHFVILSYRHAGLANPNRIRDGRDRQRALFGYARRYLGGKRSQASFDDFIFSSIMDARGDLRLGMVYR